jgi:hypothetical protein
MQWFNRAIVILREAKHTIVILGGAKYTLVILRGAKPTIVILRGAKRSRRIHDRSVDPATARRMTYSSAQDDNAVV